MNLCDNPHSVSVGQEWAAVRPRGRVPIFITANDLSLLYAVRGTRCRLLLRQCRSSVLHLQPHLALLANWLGLLGAVGARA